MMLMFWSAFGVFVLMFGVIVDRKNKDDLRRKISKKIKSDPNRLSTIAENDSEDTESLHDVLESLEDEFLSEEGKERLSLAKTSLPEKLGLESEMLR